MYSEQWNWVTTISPYTGQPKTQLTIPRTPRQELVYAPSGSLSNVRIRKHILCACGRWEYLFPHIGNCLAKGRVLVTVLCSYDVRAITAEQCRNEGYQSPFYFLRAWVRKVDPAMRWVDDRYLLHEAHSPAAHVLPAQQAWVDNLSDRPAELYQGIGITFKVVE